MVLSSLLRSAIPPIPIEESGSFYSPGAEVADEGVEVRCEYEAENGHTDHSEQHSGSEGLAHLRARPGRDRERCDTQDEGEGGH